MNETIPLAAGMAFPLSTAPVRAQSSGTGAVRPGNPPAPQLGIGGMAQVQEGQLAQNQAQPTDAKAFGQGLTGK